MAALFVFVLGNYFRAGCFLFPFYLTKHSTLVLVFSFLLSSIQRLELFFLFLVLIVVVVNYCGTIQN